VAPAAPSARGWPAGPPFRTRGCSPSTCALLGVPFGFMTEWPFGSMTGWPPLGHHIALCATTKCGARTEGTPAPKPPGAGGGCASASLCLLVRHQPKAPPEPTQQRALPPAKAPPEPTQQWALPPAKAPPEPTQQRARFPRWRLHSLVGCGLHDQPWQQGLHRGQELWPGSAIVQGVRQAQPHLRMHACVPRAARVHTCRACPCPAGRAWPHLPGMRLRLSAAQRKAGCPRAVLHAPCAGLNVLHRGIWVLELSAQCHVCAT